MLSQTQFSAGAISFDYSSHALSLLTSFVDQYPASMFPFKVMIYSLSRINSKIVCLWGPNGAYLTQFYLFFILWNWELLFYSRKNSLGLIIALDYKREAKGELYWDDGVSAGRLPYGTTTTELSEISHCKLPNTVLTLLSLILIYLYSLKSTYSEVWQLKWTSDEQVICYWLYQSNKNYWI